MPRYVAFLRAINVGGARIVKMQVLRNVFESLAFTRVSTFIASGNIVFESPRRDPKKLGRVIDAGLREALGFEVDTFVRTVSELESIASYRPFPQSKLDASVLYIIFLADAPGEQLIRKISMLNTESDEFRVHGREIYWLRRRVQGGPAFSTVLLEKTIGQPFTIRGSKTVYKVAAKYCSAE